MRRLYILFFILVPLTAKAQFISNDYVTDESLHERFDFTSNRRIDLFVDINAIDRVIQSEKFIFFLMKEGQDNTIPFTSDWDELLKFSGEFFERQLEIPYSIPICMYLKDIPNGAAANAYCIAISDILKGKGVGILNVSKSSKTLTHIPEEGTSAIKDGFNSMIGVIIHEMTHIIGINDDLLNNNYCYTTNETYSGETIYYIDTPQMRKSNGGYPVQFITGGHFVFPFALIDYDCNIAPIGGMGSPTTFNPDGLIYYHLGDASLALLETLGWKLKKGIDYSHDTYTGILFDETSVSADYRYWASLNGKLYYGGYYDKSPYTYQDWLNGEVSYKKWLSEWKKEVSEKDWIAYLDTAAYWENEYLCSSIGSFLEWKDIDAYDHFMNNIVSYLTEIYNGVSMREITLEILTRKYPQPELLSELQQIHYKNLPGWEIFIKEQDWKKKFKEWDRVTDVLGPINNFISNKNEMTYSFLIRRIADVICSIYHMIEYTEETITYLNEEYPLEVLYAILHNSTENQTVLINRDVVVYGKNGFVYLIGNVSNEKVYIYSTSGQLVNSTVMKTKEKQLYVGKGSFIVVVGSNSFKILIH